MGYAIRNDGLGWRAVNGPDECMENETFSEAEPLPVDVSHVKTQFSPLEFLELFTEEEQLAVVEATMSSAPVKLWYDKLLASTYVDILDQRTVDGLSALVAAELITEPRKNQILGNEA